MLNGIPNRSTNRMEHQTSTRPVDKLNKHVRASGRAASNTVRQLADPEVVDAPSSEPGVQTRVADMRVNFLSHLRMSTLPTIWLTVLCCVNANAQGSLTNGWTQTGTIFTAGGSDSRTFFANAGESIVVRVGKTTQ